MVKMQAFHDTQLWKSQIRFSVSQRFKTLEGHNNPRKLALMDTARLL